MSFPDFFSRIPTITVRDPLAEFLGAAKGGLIEYGYADAVRTAGHSCPTVAGAWLMTVRALRQLYGEAVPERGNVRVEFQESQDSGVAGVIGSIVTLLTGATGSGGFKGIGGHFVRRDLLSFAAPGIGGVRFSRVDNGTAVTCRLDLSSVPADPRMGQLLPALLAGGAASEDFQSFAALWQERVRRILIDHHDDPSLVILS
jgi:hypothetical protein